MKGLKPLIVREKDLVSALMRACPGLELSIILPGRSSVEEIATNTIGRMETQLVIASALVYANRTLTPIEELSRSEED